MQLQHTPEVTGVAADSRPSKTSRADDSSAELERLRDELKRVRDRAEKLLEVTTALSEANSVEDVTRVFLTKGLAVVEASRGVLVSVEGDRLRILGTRGMPPQLEAKLDVLTLASEIPIVHALRSGEMISIESADDFRRLYAGAFEGFAELADMETYLATPLIHAGETIGAIALHFSEAKALGAADRAFTLVLAQTTATALYRAKSYDAEREKRKNAELESHAREEVLGVVAHDLRNPLSLIVTTTELLKEEELEPARRDQILDIAMRAGKQMNRLIDDLLDTVHIESGKFVLSLEDTEVCAILRQAEETFRPIAERRQVKFTRSSPDGEIWVRADPFRVSQVIGNLIGNALKFTPENGSVTYGAVVSGSDIEFRVTDTGPGISPEQQQHLFEEFWQARKADRRGVGLGLTIARGIVDAHGGRIWCDSAPGKGSTFSFTLPALNRVAETAAT
jgi:signal transduction histidine kinase